MTVQLTDLNRSVVECREPVPGHENLRQLKDLYFRGDTILDAGGLFGDPSTRLNCLVSRDDRIAADRIINANPKRGRHAGNVAIPGGMEIPPHPG